MSTTVQLALISHTNNGKTTLARTLIGVNQRRKLSTFQRPILSTFEGR
jgi:translation initiation factor 2 gamma subunit (eIF-2gamma)